MKNKGLTLVELAIVVAVSAILMLGAITFWITALKNWTGERVKSHLEQQIEVGIERMKKEIRSSTDDEDKTVFYPSNPPHQAISFPMPRYTDENNRIIATVNGSVQWGSTVIYHVYTDPQTNVTELRRTVFNNRANLTKAQREAQLETVVADGDGTNACQGSETTITETVFTNLVSLELRKSATFDGYNPDVNGIRSKNVGFGSILLGPGAHNVKFQLAGKNPSSSSYGLGIDYFILDPSGSSREGEDYYASAVVSAGTKELPEDMFNNTNAVWSGNYHLEFSGAGVGSYITLPVYYDEWRETNFDNGNIAWDYTQRGETAQHDYIIKLEGNDTTWKASDQTGADKSYDSVTHEDQYIRTIISKNCLSYSGSAARVKFGSHLEYPLKITSAYFGIRDGETPNFSGAPARLTFGAGQTNDVLIPANSTVQCNWFELTAGGIPPAINKDADPKVDYLVSFHIENDVSNAYCAKWDSTDMSSTCSYIRTSGSDPDNPLTDSWVNPTASEDIFAVEDIFVGYVAQGTCTSQSYNTDVDDDDYPHYQTMSHDSSIPQDTSVSLEARAGDSEDMSGATGWVTLPSGMNNKKYIQFKTTLESTLFPYLLTAEIKSVYINWDPTAAGTNRLVDVSGYFTMRPDYGIFKVLIDDRELLRAISITMNIEAAVLNSTYTSTITAEVHPRNGEE